MTLYASYLVITLRLLNFKHGLIHLSIWILPFIIHRGSNGTVTDWVVNSEDYDQNARICKLVISMKSDHDLHWSQRQK